MTIPYWNKPPQKSDVIIIGGGLTGVATLYHLRKRGIECCLLERETLASGASGRNDGQIILETVDYYPRMKQLYGDQTAHAILDFKRKGQKLLYKFLADIKDNEALAFHQHGSLTLAYDDQEAKLIEAATTEMIKDGFGEMQLMDRDGIEALIQTKRFAMGKFDPFDSSVNPAELVRLIAAQARSMGCRIVEHCEVLEVESGKVKHKYGETECELAIITTNAYTANLLPGFENLVFPHRGQLLATEATGKEIPGVSCITNHGYDYWHWAPEGRLLIGGRRNVDEHNEVGFGQETSETVQAALEDLLAEIYPQFKGLNIEHRWSGTMGFSKDGMPIIGPVGGDPSIWTAVGFTGYGLGMFWPVGLAVAQILNDETSELTEILRRFSPQRFS